jgi:hypothetical protein
MKNGDAAAKPASDVQASTKKEKKKPDEEE